MKDIHSLIYYNKSIVWSKTCTKPQSNWAELIIVKEKQYRVIYRKIQKKSLKNDNRPAFDRKFGDAGIACS